MNAAADCYAGTGQRTTLSRRQIEATDRQIDRLVYELYGLTDEEIGIVEEAGEACILAEADV